jgi:hypothetical protein
MSSVVVNGKGCRGRHAAAKEYDGDARRSSADGPSHVGLWLMNMKMSELKPGRLGEAVLEKVSPRGRDCRFLASRHRASRGGIAAAKQGRARRARGGAGHVPDVSHGSLGPFVRVTEWTGEA